MKPGHFAKMTAEEIREAVTEWMNKHSNFDYRSRDVEFVVSENQLVGVLVKIVPRNDMTYRPQ